MPSIINSESIKRAKIMRSVCVTLAKALTQHNACEIDKADTGRKAMERIGTMLLMSLVKADAKSIKFSNVGTMLAYINNAKQTAQVVVKTHGKRPSFLDACQDSAWIKLARETVGACEVFQAEWKPVKVAETV